MVYPYTGLNVAYVQGALPPPGAPYSRDRHMVWLSPPIGEYAMLTILAIAALKGAGFSVSMVAAQIAISAVCGYVKEGK